MRTACWTRCLTSAFRLPWSCLRPFAERPETERPRRRFRTVGVFDGEPDLGRRSKEIARRELGGESSKTA
jgi:hypothetical protein